MYARTTIVAIRAITLAVLASLLLVVSAHAAGPCWPTPSAACTTGADTRAKTVVTSFAGALANGRAMRGVGLPSIAGITGKKGAPTAIRQLKAELLRWLAGGFPTPKARALMATTSGSITAPPGKVGGIVTVAQTVRNGSARLSRRTHIEVLVDRCPTMSASGNSHGSVTVQLAGSLQVSAKWRHGKRTVTRSLLVEAGPTTDAGLVSQDAAFDGINPLPNGMTELPIRVSTAGSGSRGSFSVNVDLVANLGDGPGYGIVLDSQTFGAFVDAAEAAERGDPPPGADRPLASQDAYARLIRPFLAAIDAELMRAMKRAERLWQTPNACATMNFDPLADIELAAGSQREVSARIQPRAGGLDGTNTQWPLNPTQSVGRVVQAITAGSHDGAPMRFTVEGASPVGGKTVRFTWRVPSTVGVAEGTWTAKPAAFPKTFIGTFSATVTQTGGYVFHYTGTATFTRSPTSLPIDIGSIRYDLTGGSVTLTASGSTVSCTASGGSTRGLVTDPTVATAMKLTLEDVTGNPNAPNPEPNPFYYSIWLAAFDTMNIPTYTRTCGAQATTDYAPAEFLKVGFRDWWAPNPPEIMKAQQPTVLAGSRSRSNGPSVTVDETWDFRGTTP